jgi:tRNA (guanine37-N1)-methyltransferase
MRFDVFTLFPEMFAGPFDASILKRARERGAVVTAIHNIRDWTTNRHHTADDTPYGGGAGMVMMAPPIVAAVEATLGEERATTPVMVLSAAGRRFTQNDARELAARSRLALICGHYEGIDQRVIDVLQADEVSIGDFVLTGGELAAMVVVDAVARLVPGVIEAASLAEESHGVGLVEYPHYTRPVSFRGLTVPEVLLSGHHAQIARWRREEAVRRTASRRPDLLVHADLSDEEREIAVTATAQTVTPGDKTRP